MGKRKQTKPTVVGISQKSTRTSSFSSTSYIASSVAAIAVLAVFFGSRNENSNIPERVTISMLRPSEPSEEDWIRSWQVNPETAQVDRVPFSEMTHEKLRENYLFPRRPVVLEGAYANSPLVNEWSFESIRAAYGDVHIPSFMIPAQKGHNTGCSFTGLCKNEDGMSLSKMFDETFLRPLEERKRLIRMGVPQPYPHDLDLQNMLPGMFQVYRKLSFFAENIRLVATRGTDKWPSLFFGAAGTHTGLHVDNYGTSFTMAVFRGRKQFVLFPPSDVQHLCMDAPLQLSRYGIDAFKPDFHKCPDALKSSPLFASLGPGDILFVPGSTPHAARNIEDGIGISQNFHMLGDVVSFMESGPMGFDEIQNRKNTQTFGQVQMEPEFFALRDLFHLLSDTGYKSDWSNAPLFLDANAARDMAYERVVHHLESALTQNPKLATRIAFLSGNRLVVLAMKAVGIWDCLNVDEREQVFEKPHGFPKDEARERVHAASKRIVLGDNTSWCEKAFQEYLGAIERSISNAGKEVFEEKTLHTFPSNWPKSRYLE